MLTLREKPWTKPLRYQAHPEKPESNKNLHDLIIDQTGCDGEIIAWGQKADLLPFLVFLDLFWRNLCVVRILWITLAEIVACVEVAGVQKARLVSLRFSHANILSTPWSSWFDVDDVDESNNDDDGDSGNLDDGDDDDVGDDGDDEDDAVLRGWLVGT